jgi:hypothetical protein
MNPIHAILGVIKLVRWIRKHVPKDVREAALQAVKEAGILPNLVDHNDRREYAVRHVMKLTGAKENRARAAVEMAVGVIKERE